MDQTQYSTGSPHSSFPDLASFCSRNWKVPVREISRHTKPHPTIDKGTEQQPKQFSRDASGSITGITTLTSQQKNWRVLKGKGTVHPRTGHKDPEGKWKIQSQSFFYLGTRMGWVFNAAPQLLYPQERDPVPIVREAGWAPGLV